MTVASVTTDINIGPFKIPSNAQNMIMNNYADRNKISIELVIPEPMMSRSLATLQWIHNDRKLSSVILSSIYQLPDEGNKISDIINNMSEVNFHFAIEGLNGKGGDFLHKCIEEAKKFMKISMIDSTKTKWSELYEIRKNLI